MINPHSSYVISFSLALGMYWLGWSRLYPRITNSLFTFLLLTVVIHLILSFYWRSKKVAVPKLINSFFNPIATTIFIYVLWAADFIYEGGIPLLKILLSQPYNYRLFGVPSLHVFTVTFGSFFTIFLFSLYVSTRQRTYLYLYLINMLAALLIYSRGMMMFNLVGSVFVYLLSSPSISWKQFLVGLIALICVSYFFGVLGTVRDSFEAKRNYDTNIFMDTGQASEAFRKSKIPDEFFWGYIYLSSPLANLQQNINTFKVPPFSFSRLMQHLNNEMTFDFMSKRINRIWGVEREQERTLPNTPFNVSTVYSRSYSYQGWVGMFIMCVFILIVPWIYLQILPANQYSLCGLAILNTAYVFLMYDNTIRFTGLGLQLVYPFALPFAERAATWFQKRLVS